MSVAGLRWLAAASAASMLVAGGCAQAPSSGERSEDVVTRWVGGRLPGGEPVELVIQGGRFAFVGPPGGAGALAGDVVTEDLAGGFVVPGFVDSHVHLVFRGEAERLPQNGLSAVVDLAAPLPLPPAPPGLEVVHAGPMIAAPLGYPTQSWGRDGYGAECATAADVVDAVTRAYEGGARVVKLSFDQGPDLDDARARAAVAEAHARGMKVAVHALTDAGAARAAALGADVLAHTPTEPLSDATIAAWRGRAVVSTLAAFGGGAQTVENLTKLRAAGARVLYGTDLGNTQEAAIQGEELRLLLDAGLTAADILAASTTEPAAFWGLGAGSLEAGKSARFFVVATDPLADIRAVLERLAVFSDGERASTR